ncbi:hypothetical protein C2E23DRAFT_728451 [Lenzites betulinus]|nr:hypothetical protein C2E23DRAFT_728451 [Lenzites betulinus]
MPSGSTPLSFPEDSHNIFATEFLRHPDFRATAGFLLGWVFWCSVSYAYKSQFFQLLGYTCWTFLRRSRSRASDVEARGSADPEKYPWRGEASVQGMHYEAALVFTLNLCFAFASFAEFSSILAYDPGGANTACAFTVAWANMAAQAARLIGLAILVLQLKQRIGWSKEFYCLSGALIVVLSFILAFNATNTGDIVRVQTLGVSICVKIRFLPTALLAGVGFILLELYMAIRLMGWEDRQHGWGRMLKKSANLQVARAISLLLIDVLTLPPNVVDTNVLAQFIPFSLAALIVLTAFNWRIYDNLTKQESEPELSASHPSHGPVALPPSRPEYPGSPVAPRSPPVEPQDHDVIVIDTPTVLRSREAVGNTADQAVVVPNSAPPRMGHEPDFADLQSRQILPFQAQYAERLERHIHVGPIVPARPQRQRPDVRVVIEDTDTARNSTMGSDIMRLSSAAPRRRMKDARIWSPSTVATPSDYSVSQSSSAPTPTSATRHSNLSMATSFNRSMSSGSRNKISSFLSRHGSRKVRSPAELSVKGPWRAAPRASFASGRTFGMREELTPVAESNTEKGSARPSSSTHRLSAASSKRLVISRPHSLRPSRPVSPGPSRLGLGFATVSSYHRTSSQHLTVPDRVQTPPTPSSLSSIRPSSQYIVPMPPTPTLASYERATGSGRLRGPRTPPMSSSSPNLRSAWPTAAEADEDGRLVAHRRTRSGSCPELPPLDLGKVPALR